MTKTWAPYLNIYRDVVYPYFVPQHTACFDVRFENRIPQLTDLKDHIAKLKDSGEKALGIFVTSGFPNLEATPDILQAIDDGGADFIEIGMPFSDPLAEGIPIQRSSQKALAAGVTMQDTLQFAASFREKSETPVVLMGYANPVMQYGISNFFKDARSSGVNGVILPDVLPETDSPFYLAARKEGIDLICLISPTTPPKRMKKIDQLSSGFVYAVSMTGVTGLEISRTDPIGEYLKEARSHVTRNHLLVGFGIRTAADVNEMARHVDGAIVGSALVDLVDKLWVDDTLDHKRRIRGIIDFVNDLKSGTKGTPGTPGTPGTL